MKTGTVKDVMNDFKNGTYDFTNNKKKTIFRREHKLDQIIDHTYPIIRWHPSGKMLGFFIEKKGNSNYNKIIYHM